MSIDVHICCAENTALYHSVHMRICTALSGCQPLFCLNEPKSTHELDNKAHCHLAECVRNKPVVTWKKMCCLPTNCPCLGGFLESMSQATIALEASPGTYLLPSTLSQKLGSGQLLIRVCLVCQASTSPLTHQAQMPVAHPSISINCHHLT